jgi:hypothetical protein
MLPYVINFGVKKFDALRAISLTSNLHKHGHNNQSELTEECDRRLLFQFLLSEDLRVTDMDQ